jgi:hypothetical protein
MPATGRSANSRASRANERSRALFFDDDDDDDDAAAAAAEDGLRATTLAVGVGGDSINAAVRKPNGDDNNDNEGLYDRELLPVADSEGNTGSESDATEDEGDDAGADLSDETSVDADVDDKTVKPRQSAGAGDANGSDGDEDVSDGNAAGDALHDGDGEEPSGALAQTFFGALEGIFSDPDIVERLDLSSLEQIRTLTDKSDKSNQAIVAHIAHFAHVNEHLLGDAAKRLGIFIAAVGQTSTGKDVTIAQLLDKDVLAVSGKNMTTAAPVSYFVVPATRQLSNDRFTVQFDGRRIYEGEDPKNFRAAMHKLMEEIRGPDGTSFTTKKVVVKVESANPNVWPSFALNTVGMMPQVNGRDKIFGQLDATLTKVNASEGGMLVICHDVQRPVDLSAVWRDLAVVRLFVADRGLAARARRCKMHIVVARTMCDLITDAEFAKCKTHEQLYVMLFGPLEEVMDGVHVFAITGWPADNPLQRDKTADVFEARLHKALQRIDAKWAHDTLQQQFKQRVLARCGTAKLIAEYQRYMAKAGRDVAQLALQCLLKGQAAMRARYEHLSTLRKQLHHVSVQELIGDICLDTEKLAESLRLNNLERPHNATASIEHVHRMAVTRGVTLEQEFELAFERASVTLSVDRRKVAGAISRAPRKMNRAPHFVFWARLLRLKANARTLAGVYGWKKLKTEDINMFTQSRAVRDEAYVEDFVNIYVLSRVRSAFLDEIVPLLSAWVSMLLHDSYKLAYDICRGLPKYAMLANNSVFDELMRDVLYQLYYTDVVDKIRDLAIIQAPAFIERINVERDRRDRQYAAAVSEREWARYCKRLGTTKAPFQQFLSAVTPFKSSRKAADGAGGGSGVDAVGDDEPHDGGGDSGLATADEEKLLNENHVVPRSSAVFLAMHEDEGQLLNEIGRFFFKEMLTQAIEFFFRQTETELDFAYSQSLFHKQAKFLFKHLFFAAHSAAQASPTSALHRLEQAIAAMPPSRRYCGYDVEQLVAMRALQLVNPLSGMAGQRGAVGSPPSKATPAKVGAKHGSKSALAPTTASNNQTHVEEVDEQDEQSAPRQKGPTAGAPGKSGKPTTPVESDDNDAELADYVGVEQDMLDLTYGRPRGRLPGYREPLHADMLREAERFLGESFDDNKQRSSELSSDMRKVRMSMEALEVATKALRAAV